MARSAKYFFEAYRTKKRSKIYFIGFETLFRLGNISFGHRPIFSIRDQESSLVPIGETKLNCNTFYFFHVGAKRG